MAKNHCRLCRPRPSWSSSLTTMARSTSGLAATPARPGCDKGTVSVHNLSPVSHRTPRSHVHRQQCAAICAIVADGRRGEVRRRHTHRYGRTPQPYQSPSLGNDPDVSEVRVRRRRRRGCASGATRRPQAAVVRRAAWPRSLSAEPQCPARPRRTPNTRASCRPARSRWATAP